MAGNEKQLILFWKGNMAGKASSILQILDIIPPLLFFSKYATIQTSTRLFI